MTMEGGLGGIEKAAPAIIVSFPANDGLEEYVIIGGNGSFLSRAGDATEKKTEFWDVSAISPGSSHVIASREG